MILLAQMPPVDTAAWWPFVCLLAGMLTVVTGIAWLKCHAFLSLMLAAMVVGLTHLLQPGEAPVLQDWLNAFNDPMMAFGGVAGQIAWLIALASVIGMCMMASGASERIVRTLIQSFGAKRAPWALMASGFVLGIPVFFDTVFFLLIPLARGLALRTGHGYAASIMAISSGAVITHTLVPPTPGTL
ncbi:MAG: SLC13 family permease, partial [Limisphaerales bacterium]